MSLRLDWCSHEAAKYAVEHWHYTKTLPVGKLVKIGVWEHETFIGCVLYSRGASQHIGRPFNLPQTEICELTRVALNTHASSVSRILSLSLKFLKKQSPGVRLVVSYADTGQGHHGGIYQASNWVFVGSSPPAQEYLLHGRWVHSMQIQTFIRLGKIKTRTGMISRETSVKHKYVMPLDDDMRKQIAPLSKTYPKRPTQHEPAPPASGRCDSDPDAPISHGPNTP